MIEQALAENGPWAAVFLPRGDPSAARIRTRSDFALDGDNDLPNLFVDSMNLCASAISPNGKILAMIGFERAYAQPLCNECDAAGEPLQGHS